MNSHRTYLIPGTLALCLGLSANVFAQTRANLPDREPGAARGTPPAASLPSTTSSVAASVAALHSDNLQRAANDYDDHGFRSLEGRDIKGSDDKKLGEIHDFTVDPKTGTITHAIASSGGVLGIGNVFRVLPVDRLTLADDAIATPLDARAFESLPTVTRDELGEDRLSLAMRGIRVGALLDRELRASNTEAGAIEDVVLDFQSGVAFAVVDVNDEFAGTEGKFLVPFSRLNLGGAASDTIAADIARADFAHVQPETAQLAGSPASPNPETQPLSPTGRADPGSDNPRHDDRTFGAAQDDSTTGGRAPNATPTDRDAANTDGRPNLSTTVPSRLSDPWFPEEGGNARGSVTPANDDPEERLEPTGRTDAQNREPDSGKQR